MGDGGHSNVNCERFLFSGQNITCNFQSGIIYDQGCAVWIDWNKNNVFDIWSEQVCAPAGVPIANTWASANFVVPAVAAGTYRMRVRSAYATNGPSILPYMVYSFGETEDYNLVVGAGVICPLPIQLVFYDAAVLEKSIEIKWTTASEINSDYYTLERSYNNEDFEMITKKPAAGNSDEGNDYSFIDNEIRGNTVIYYRLKEFDKGKNEREFTKTISVYSINHQTGFEIYPNPVASNLKLLFDAAATESLLRSILNPMLAQGVDTLILGCTHYPFVQPLIEQIVGPNVTIIDPAPAVARQTARVLQTNSQLTRSRQPGQITLYTTGDVAQMARLSENLWGEKLGVAAARLT